MSTVDVNHLVGSLQEALERIQTDRQTFDARVEQIHAAFDAREAMIQQSISGLTEVFSTDEFPSRDSEAPDAPDPATSDEPRLSVSDKFVSQVDKYLAKHGKARQADIVSATKLNSGTVSVALRRLALDDRIERGDKERGSQVWVHKAPTNGQRETVVRPGEGVAAGRIAA